MKLTDIEIFIIFMWKPMTNVSDSVNPNTHSISFKSNSSFVLTAKPGIFTDIAITMMFFSRMFSFPRRVKT